MLDDVLGRTRLKERIEELEDEVDRLEEKLEAESRRRKKAVTEKQEAEEEINRLESKIDELRDRVERAESDTDERGFRRVEELSGARLADVLDLLESVEGAVTTAYVEPGGAIPDVVDSKGALRGIDTETGLVILTDGVGVVDVCLVPPLRVEEPRLEHGSRLDVDRSLFETDGEDARVYALAVVRSDSYAGGVYGGRDGGRVAESFHTSSVKGSHSKGGFSQSRFERIRDDQIREHVDESAEEFERMVEESGVEPDFVGVGGEKAVVDAFVERIGFDDPVTRRLDATGEREELLERGREAFWTARLYAF